MKWIKYLERVLVVTLMSATLYFAIHYGQDLFIVQNIHFQWSKESEQFCSDNQKLCAQLEEGIQEKLKSQIGQKIHKVSIRQIRSEALLNNWFENLSIQRQLPSRLEAEAKLVNPEAIVYTDKQLFAIGPQGQLLASQKINYLPSLPILRGENFLQDAQLRKQALEFLRNFPSTGEMSLAFVSELTYSPEESFSFIILPSRNLVKMTPDNVSLRLARVSQVIEYLNSRQMNSRVIDARFSKKVLVRLRKGS